MNISLMKYLGNMDQIAGIREYQLLRGRGQQMQIAEFYNAAGLRFTVVPDRGMDLYGFSYKGVNFAFHSKNGLTSPRLTVPQRENFVSSGPVVCWPPADWTT